MDSRPHSAFSNIQGLHTGPATFDGSQTTHQTICSAGSDDTDSPTDVDWVMESIDGPFYDDGLSTGCHPSVDSLETRNSIWDTGLDLLLETPAQPSGILAEQTDKIEDPTTHSLDSNDDDLLCSPNQGRTIFLSRQPEESPEAISPWSSLDVTTMGLMNVGLCNGPSELPLVDSAQTEACVDPALVFPRPIPYATESDDSEDEGSDIYDAWDKVSEEYTSNVENIERRDLTPALSESASITLSIDSPEPVTPSTPSLELGGHVILLPASRLCVDKGKRRASDEKVKFASPVCDATSPSRTLRKRKRAATKAKDETDFEDDESGDESPALDNRHRATSGKKSGNSLSTDFLVQRFDITVVSNDEYPCPFLPEGFLGPACGGLFKAPRLREHIMAHVNSFKGDGHMLCPLRSARGCNWLKEKYKSIGTYDPNEGLPRHIVETHLKATTLRCPCDGTISRKSIDHVLRHLHTSKHVTGLAKKRKADRTFPKYPDVDDPCLLIEQARSRNNWETINFEADDEHDKGEGSSKGTKRRRLS